MPSPLAIAKERGLHLVERGVLGIEAADRLDGVGVALGDLEGGSVQQQREVGFFEDLFQQQRIEEDGVAFGVAVVVLDEDLADDAAFAGPAVVAAHVAGGAQDPEADLAGGIAAEDGAVLHEHDLGAGTGGGDRTAGASHTAADDGQVA